MSNADTTIASREVTSEPTHPIEAETAPPRSPLSEIRWGHAGEPEDETPANPLDISLDKAYQLQIPDKAEAQYEKVREKAQKIRESPYRRHLADYRNIFALHGRGRPRVDDFTRLPVELDYLTVALDAFGKGGEHPREYELDALGTAFAHLRPSNSWTNDLISLNRDAASLIVADLKGIAARIDEDHRFTGTYTHNLKQQALDATIFAAISCGDVRTAFTLMTRAGEVLGDDATRGYAEALARFTDPTTRGGTGLIETIRDAYPRTYQQVTDAIIIDSAKSKEAPAPLQDLADRAAIHLKDNLIADRDRWYACQYLPRDPGEREIAAPDLTQLLNEVIQKGQTSEQFRQSLTALAHAAARRRASRLVAAELIRRLHPEQTIHEQMERALGFWGTGRRFPPHNQWDNVFSEHVRRYQPETHPTRVRNIFELQTFQNRPITASDETRELVSVDDFLKFLKDPYAWRMSLQTHNRNWSTEPGYDTWKKTVARKFAAGIAFLKTVAADPVGRDLLAQEFGLEQPTTPQIKLSLISDATLNEAEDSLRRALGDKVYDEARPPETQSVQDAEVLSQIGRALNTEQGRLYGETVDTAREARDALVTTLEAQKAELADKQATLAQLQQQKRTLENHHNRTQEAWAGIHTLEPTAGLRRFFPGALTQESIKQQEYQAKSIVVQAREQLDAVTAQITAVGTVDEAALEAIPRKILDLQALI